MTNVSWQGGLAGGGVTVRPESQADEREIARVVEAAFGSTVQVDLVSEIRSAKEYVPALSLVAVMHDQIVGHVMISFATLVRDQGPPVPIGNLSPLAVHPDQQSLGIGGALVEQVLGRADDMRVPLVVLEGDPRYYGDRLGFESATRLGIHIPLPDWAPAAAAQARRLSSYRPDMRGRVVYPEPFLNLDH